MSSAGDKPSEGFVSLESRITEAAAG